MANRSPLPLIAIAGAFAAGVGATALYFGREPQPGVDAASTSGPTETPPRALRQQSTSPGGGQVRGTLPPLHGGATQAAHVDEQTADPRLQALEAQVARLAALVEQQQASPSAAVLGGSPPPSTVAQPLYPEPYIIPGTENRAGGPILAAFGPPPPFNTGSRAPDPPAVSGAGCGTCEAGASSQR